MVSVGFGAGILRRRNPGRVSVVWVSTIERVANGEVGKFGSTAELVKRTGVFFGIRADVSKAERSCRNR